MKFISFLSAVILMFSTQLNGHCQIPCGVYDDAMRVKMIEEHTLTILKSMNYTLRSPISGSLKESTTTISKDFTSSVFSPYIAL